MDNDYIEFAEVDGMWVRAYTLAKAHTVAAQHVHAHDHITLLASGSVKFWQEGIEIAQYDAPAVITVPANKRHAFQATTDNVVLCCLHNLRGTGLEEPDAIHEVS